MKGATGHFLCVFCLGWAAVLVPVHGITGDLLDRTRLACTFNEDFDRPASFYSPSTGTGRWKTNYFFGHQNDHTSRTLDGEWEIFSDQAYNGINPFLQQQGTMALIADQNYHRDLQLNGSRPYSSGLLTTEKSFAQTYGYFEVRAALPTGRGLWPQIWMLSATRGADEEIDIMENLGRDPGTIYCSIHQKNLPQSVNQTYPVPIAAITSMHTYGVLWSRNELVWYLDDKEVAHHANTGLHDPMYMLISLSVGGSWGGYPNASTHFPAQMVIDYVRAYEQR